MKTLPLQGFSTGIVFDAGTHSLLMKHSDRIVGHAEAKARRALRNIPQRFVTASTVAAQCDELYKTIYYLKPLAS